MSTPHHEEIARPLQSLTEKDVSFVWCPECEYAFQTLKEKLMEAPMYIKYIMSIIILWLKKFKYMFEIDILRISLQKYFGCPEG